MYSYSGCGFGGGCSPGKFWGIFSEDSSLVFSMIFTYHLRIFTCNLLTPLLGIPSDHLILLLQSSRLSSFTHKVRYLRIMYVSRQLWCETTRGGFFLGPWCSFWFSRWDLVIPCIFQKMLPGASVTSVFQHCRSKGGKCPRMIIDSKLIRDFL